MSIDKIRVGVVGAGQNTRVQHIPRLQAIEGVEIVSVCNRSRASSEQVSREFGIPTVYEHWTDLVAAPDTNAIVIGTWPYLHAPITLAALAAGKHVLCEARMAMNAAEAHAMWDAARARPDLVAQLVPAPFSFRVDRTIQRLIAEGYIGQVLAVEVREGNAFLDPSAPLHWRQNMDLSGFNIMTMGIWYEQMLRWVGPATRVMALGKTFAKQRRDETGRLRATSIPEYVTIMADLACGAQALIRHANVTGLAGGPEAYFFGSEGTLRFAQNNLFGGRRGDKALAEIAIPAEEEGGWRVEEEFVNAIRGLEAISHTTFADGVKYMEFTEAVHRSMATGQAIALPL